MNTDPLYEEAIERFREWLQQAQQLALKEPSAVALTTADSQGRPSVRIVLLRGFDQRGFVFFTNSHSRKGQHLAQNPNAALCFYWDALGRQIRVDGSVEQIADEESDTYWKSRSRASQIGAWASQQSQLLDSRQTLDRRYSEYEKKFQGSEVPRPAHWFGYRLIPQSIEFWESRPARLHERVAYEKAPSGWKVQLVYP